MQVAQSDQRTSRRFLRQLPVSVSFPQGAGDAEAETRDLSARGICFYMDKELAAGSNIEFTLTLPSEITLSEAVRVRCKGLVVRVENTSTGKVAIAAQIDQYEFIA